VTVVILTAPNIILCVTVPKKLIMDTYVKVGNDLQLAVRYIILSKKAFLKQSRCIKVLTKHNDLLQEKVKGLEMNNKELRALSLLTKQNQNLKNQMSELVMGEHETRERVLDEILAGDTFVLSDGVTSQEDSTASSDIVSTGDEGEEEAACPLSPKKRKRIQNKECHTPSTKKKKDDQHTDKQTGSTNAAEDETTELSIMSLRRSSRLEKQNDDN
jgi:hypothetical protein